LLSKFQEHCVFAGEASSFELMFTSLLYQFDAIDRYHRSIESLETKHGSKPLLDSAMILLYNIIQVFAGSHPNPVRHCSRRFHFRDSSM
jgi:hypothetical protein